MQDSDLTQPSSFQSSDIAALLGRLEKMVQEDSPLCPLLAKQADLFDLPALARRVIRLWRRDLAMIQVGVYSDSQLRDGVRADLLLMQALLDGAAPHENLVADFAELITQMVGIILLYNQQMMALHIAGGTARNTA